MLDQIDITIMYLNGEGQRAEEYLRLSRFTREIERKHRSLTNTKILSNMKPEEVKFLYDRVSKIRNDLISSKMKELIDTKPHWDMAGDILRFMMPFLPQSDKSSKVPKDEVNRNLRKEKAKAGKNHSNKHIVKVGEPCRKKKASNLWFCAKSLGKSVG